MEQCYNQPSHTGQGKNIVFYLEINVNGLNTNGAMFTVLSKRHSFGVSPKENFLGLAQPLSFVILGYSLTPASEQLRGRARKVAPVPRALLKSYRPFHCCEHNETTVSNVT